MSPTLVSWDSNWRKPENIKSALFGSWHPCPSRVAEQIGASIRTAHHSLLPWNGVLQIEAERLKYLSHLSQEQRQSFAMVRWVPLMKKMSFYSEPLDNPYFWSSGLLRGGINVLRIWYHWPHHKYWDSTGAFTLLSLRCARKAAFKTTTISSKKF